MKNLIEYCGCGKKKSNECKITFSMCMDYPDGFYNVDSYECGYEDKLGTPPEDKLKQE